MRWAATNINKIFSSTNNSNITWDSNDSVEQRTTARNIYIGIYTTYSNSSEYMNMWVYVCLIASDFPIFHVRLRYWSTQIVGSVVVRCSLRSTKVAISQISIICEFYPIYLVLFNFGWCNRKLYIVQIDQDNQIVVVFVVVITNIVKIVGGTTVEKTEKRMKKTDRKWINLHILSHNLWKRKLLVFLCDAWKRERKQVKHNDQTVINCEMANECCCFFF